MYVWCLRRRLEKTQSVTETSGTRHTGHIRAQIPGVSVVPRSFARAATPTRQLLPVNGECVINSRVARLRQTITFSTTVLQHNNTILSNLRPRVPDHSTLDPARKLNLCSLPTTTWQHPTRATSHQLYPLLPLSDRTWHG